MNINVPYTLDPASLDAIIKAMRVFERATGSRLLIGDGVHLRAPD